MSPASQDNSPAGAVQLPEQKAFFKIPARFGHVPVAEEPLGYDHERRFEQHYPRIELPFQLVDTVETKIKKRYEKDELFPNGLNRLFFGDCLHVMRMLPSECIDLIYIDPPFFSGRNYNIIFGDRNEVRSFTDIWEGGMPGYMIWLNTRLYEMKRLLKSTGTLYVHLDWHAVHYVKCELDKIFGYDQVIGRGLRRVFPRKEAEKERLIVVDHPKLDHEWLWQMIDAYVRTDVGIQEELDLDEGLEEPEEVHASEDKIEIPEPTDEGEGIELPEPEELEDKPFDQEWTEYLAAVQYPREQIAVTREDRVGESERDLTGTGFVTTVAYSDAEKQPTEEFIPPKESIPLDQRQKELCDQLFDLTVEVLFNNGLPMSGRAVIYKVLLAHVSDKFLGGQTIGQCGTESQLLFLQDSLHYVRRVFDRRELLKAILDKPPDA